MEGLGKHPRMALAGCGYWGKNLARNFHQLGALQLIIDPSIEGKANAAKVAPGIPVLDHFEKAIADPGIEAVALATPAETHATLAIKAVKAGKHVFCEKPLATTVEDGEAMLEAAHNARRVLMVGHILEYHPAVREIYSLLAEGVLGTLLSINCQRLNWGKVRTVENVLWSFSPHDLALILGFANEAPIEVEATGTAHLTKDIEETATIQLKFPSGLQASVFASWRHPFKRQEITLVGEKAQVVFDDTLAEGKLRLFRHRIEQTATGPRTLTAPPETIPLPDAEPLREECIHFLNAVRDGSQPKTDGARGLEVLKILKHCDEQLRSEALVAL